MLWGGQKQKPKGAKNRGGPTPPPPTPPPTTPRRGGGERNKKKPPPPLCEKSEVKYELIRTHPEYPVTKWAALSRCVDQCVL